MNKSSLCVLAFVAIVGALAGAEPKRVLLVTTTTGFRHSSIEMGEKVLRELAVKSGEFAVVSTSEHPFHPNYVGGRGDSGGVTVPAGTTTAQKAALAALNTAAQAASQQVAAARQALTQASFSIPTAIPERTRALADAELSLATTRATSFAALQASANRLAPELVAVLSEPRPIRLNSNL